MSKLGIIELNRLHYANEIVDFVKKSKRAPLVDSTKKEVEDFERLLGCKLSGLRRIYKHNLLSKPILDVFKSNGMEMDILARDYEYTGIQNLIAIYKFKLMNGKYPALRSKDKVERRLAVVHNNMKLANRGKHTTTMTMYDSYYKLIKAYGMLDFFDGCSYDNTHKTERKTWIRGNTDTERTEMETIQNVCKFISKYGKKPNKNSVNGYESKLAYRFRRLYRKYRDCGIPKKYIKYASELGVRCFN